MHARPASLEDLWAFMARRNAPVRPQAYTELVKEVLAGHVSAVFDGDAPLILGGVQRMRDGGGVAWFSATPERMGGSPLRVARAIRTYLGQQGLASIAAYVDATNTKGQRLAALTGFAPSGRSAFGLIEYRWEGIDGRHSGCHHGRRAEAPGGGDGGRSSAPAG